MALRFRLETPLSDDSLPAVEIAAALTAAGHVALLAGGCARDLLMGREPQDYDVATDATPQRVCELFSATRKVGAQFGVVLVRKRSRWVEVATFRSDVGYSDGRRPDAVVFGDAEQDALRRDFTVNGMFLDSISREVIDYVGGRADLDARLIRAIGDPAARFEEDHLRLLRAIRFAARLDFEIEPQTQQAIRGSATKLALVAAERVREELEKMLRGESRKRAFDLLIAANLLPFVWPGANWPESRIRGTTALLEHLPSDAGFELAFTTLVCDLSLDEIDRICRVLAFSNDQREDVLWLVRHQADLDDPYIISLAALKRLMANRAFPSLRQLASARSVAHGLDPRRRNTLNDRLNTIPPDQVRPPPFVTGDDLTARRVPAGPIYKTLLDELYTRQLNETLTSRETALRDLDELLKK